MYCVHCNLHLYWAVEGQRLIIVGQLIGRWIMRVKAIHKKAKTKASIRLSYTCVLRNSNR